MAAKPRTPEDEPIPPSTLAAGRDMERRRLISDPIPQIEDAHFERVFDGARPRRSLVTRSRPFLRVGVGHQLDRCSLRVHMREIDTWPKDWAASPDGVHVSDTSPKSNKAEHTRKLVCRLPRMHLQVALELAALTTDVLAKRMVSRLPGSVRWRKRALLTGRWSGRSFLRQELPAPKTAAATRVRRYGALTRDII